MNRLRTRLVLATGLLLVATPALSDQVPLTFHALDGSAHTLAELRGHPAVVNFWATWCGPCREEMPRLQRLADHYAAQGVRFVAISLDAKDTQAKIAPTVAKRGFNIPVWTGADDKTLTTLNLGDLVPATLILDADGRVIGRIEGEARDKDLTSRLDWALGGETGKAPRLDVRHDW